MPSIIAAIIVAGYLTPPQCTPSEQASYDQLGSLSSALSAGGAATIAITGIVAIAAPGDMPAPSLAAAGVLGFVELLASVVVRDERRRSPCWVSADATD